jgi:pimeloyl-ACP methyl ester carboxylesterase
MVYLIPGLGADYRVFEQLSLSGIEYRILEWIHPEKDEPVEHYVRRLLPQITEAPEYFVGLSFGGVVGAELRKHFPDAKLILISSIANRGELPWWSRLGGALRINRLFSGKFLKHRNPVIRWIFGVSKGRDTELFNAILKDSDPDFLYWAFDEILNWKGNGAHRIHHIHGRKDRLIPMRFTTADIRIEDGGHFMIVSHGKEISSILTEMLRRLDA